MHSTTLLNQYLAVRQQTESLCKPLNIEDYIPQAVEFASPPKWHLAHLSWFFEEMILQKHLSGYCAFNKDFNFLFNSYYETVGARANRFERGVMTRPTVDEVYQYRAYVDTHMTALLSTPQSDEINSLVVLGINHEQQHQELLLTDLKYVFSLNPTFPVYEKNANLLLDKNVSSGWLSVDEGVYQIGHLGEEFYFDNELAAHKVYLHDYNIAKALVTNGEFITFIEEGGYEQFQHWLDEGWRWVTENKISKPMYWHKKQADWYHYTLAGLKPVDTNAILAHVSYYEANAFAHWKGCRLPTEFEWEAAANQLDWGKRWEWTASAYQPYPGFSVNDGAVGEYNGKFMANQMVLRGASVATAADHSRATYRNFFHPHHQWQYSGIRLAQ